MKRLFSALLIVCLLLVLAPAGALADDSQTGEIVVATVSGQPGEQAEVTISITKNPGIVTAKLAIHYDAALSLVTVKDAGLLVGALHGGDLNANPYNLYWDDPLSRDNNTKTGLLATLVFAVDSEAASGVYKVWVTYDPEEVYNVDMDNVAFSATEGGVQLAQAVECKIVDGIYYENDTPVPYKGFVLFDGNYYYVNDNARVVKSTTRYCKTTNGLTYPNGTDLTAGNYTFDENGRMIIMNGLYDGVYYEDNKPVAYKGLIEDNGSFYYVNDNGRVVTGKDYYVSKTNDLTYANGVAITKGTYTFGADGKMLIKNGLQDGVYYENNKPVPYKGLIEVEGDFYYVNDNGRVVAGKDYCISNTNGLTYANGVAITKGTYTFGTDGKMVVRNGLYDGVYYENNKPVPYKGLIEVDGDFYYVNDNGRVVAGKDYCISKTNDLTYASGVAITKGTYTFGADGKMLIKNGLYGDVYYENNKPVPYKGFVVVEGDYYYVNDGGRIVKNVTRYCATTNGLTYPNGEALAAGTFTFDADGKMVVRNGLYDGVYYENNKLVPYKGFVIVDGDYYYVNNGSKVVKNTTRYCITTNGLKNPDGTDMKKGIYTFDADGKVVW